MDIRSAIFREHAEEKYIAHIFAERPGVLSGAEEAAALAKELGIQLLHQSEESTPLVPGEPIFTLCGTPTQLAEAEEQMIGAMAKTSGIATAAREFRETAGNELKVVCGAWKKVPHCVRNAYKQAVLTGGCACRILDEPMIYLDKNYVAMLDGIRATMKDIGKRKEFTDRKKVIQVKGRSGDLANECWTAAYYGADVLYIDTGCIQDLEQLQKAKDYMEKVPLIAFGGNVVLTDLEKLRKNSVDIVGVGRAIIDAPMLDMKMEVLQKSRPLQCDHSHVEEV